MTGDGIWHPALAAFGTAALAVAALLVACGPVAPTSLPLVVTTAAPSRPPTRQPTPHDITVDVAGAVARPGVYTLHPGSRAEDGLAAAGGALDDADLDRVNLAAPLSDGEQLLVPRQGEATPTPVRAGRGGAATRGPTPTPPGDWLLNVNTATAADFRALPGVGKVTADRLVAYRQQHGPYASVDDLLKAGLHKSELDRIRTRLTIQ